jgi:hypothetical protein
VADWTFARGWKAKRHAFSQVLKGRQADRELRNEGDRRYDRTCTDEMIPTMPGPITGQ